MLLTMRKNYLKNKLFIKKLAIILFAISTLLGCTTEPLPYIGPQKIVNGDTLKHSIPTFNFINQNNDTVTNQNLKGKIYVADFFFTSCPSICPKVKIEMLKIYDEFLQEPDFKMMSHTMDPKRDTPEKLKTYAKNLDVNTNKWMFLTGNQDDLMDISNKGYFVSAEEDETAPGGFNHSGKIMLIDKNGRIRAYSEGTKPKETPILIKKIKQLLNEKNE